VVLFCKVRNMENKKMEKEYTERELSLLLTRTMSMEDELNSIIKFE